MNGRFNVGAMSTREIAVTLNRTILTADEAVALVNEYNDRKQAKNSRRRRYLRYMQRVRKGRLCV